jgi:hypothetical protein
MKIAAKRVPTRSHNPYNNVININANILSKQGAQIMQKLCFSERVET